jgi:hypothetical protein
MHNLNKNQQIELGNQIHEQKLKEKRLRSKLQRDDAKENLFETKLNHLKS